MLELGFGTAFASGRVGVVVVGDSDQLLQFATILLSARRRGPRLRLRRVHLPPMDRRTAPLLTGDLPQGHARVTRAGFRGLPQLLTSAVRANPDARCRTTLAAACSFG